MVVITNQSGIARGLFTEDDLEAIHRKMKAALSGPRSGIDAVYYCPHHPDDGCSCRKPGTLSFEKAVDALDLDARASFMVGDTTMDIEAGRTMGCRTVLVTTGPDGGKGAAGTADYTAENLLDGARWIVGQPPR